MYFGIEFLLAAALICSACSLLVLYRKRRAVCRLCRMSFCEKVSLLRELLLPWGFTYLPAGDMVSTLPDAWQRDFGYRALFDKSAVHVHMVFDCEPVYFDHRGRTWLIEFWKGQYGINTGAEIGVYYADGLLTPAQYETAQFHAAKDGELLPLSMELYHRGERLFSVSRCHWWLTGFRVGRFSQPRELQLRVSVRFCDPGMREAFVRGLLEMGYSGRELQICGDEVCLVFDRPRSESGRRISRRGCYAELIQRSNRLFAGIFCKLTGRFCTALDRVLYLYLLLPFAFRRIFRFGTCRGRRR